MRATGGTIFEARVFEDSTYVNNPSDFVSVLPQ